MSDFFSYQTAAEPPRGRVAQAASTGPALPPQWVLQELAPEDWEHVLRFAARRRHGAGSAIVALGAAEPALHLIASGQVRLEAPGQPPQLRGEGEAFGLLSFLDGAPSAVAATVTAAGPAELLRLTPESLQQLAAWQPRVAMALLRDVGALVAARLRALQPAD
jgi:CRP-like cAMP-binding protein